MPLISIVIPTYNYARFLGRALDSVLAQTESDWEAIVVDNHSEDDTDEVVAAKNDPRIRLIKVRNNGVIAVSRNLGIRESGGKWISFLDSDDVWYPRKLERVLAAGESVPGFDVVCNDELQVDIASGAQRVLRHGPYQPDFYRALLVEGNRLSTSATTVRSEFLARHSLVFSESPDHIAVEDYDLWMHLARCGARFKFVHEVLGEFVVHQANSSALVTRQITNGERLLRDHIFNIQKFEPARDKLWSRAAARLRYSEIAHLARLGRRGTAVRLGAGTLVKSPLSAAAFLLARTRKAIGGVR